MLYHFKFIGFLLRISQFRLWYLQSERVFLVSTTKFIFLITFQQVCLTHDWRNFLHELTGSIFLHILKFWQIQWKRPVIVLISIIFAGILCKLLDHFLYLVKVTHPFVIGFVLKDLISIQRFLYCCVTVFCLLINLRNLFRKAFLSIERLLFRKHSGQFT